MRSHVHGSETDPAWHYSTSAKSRSKILLATEGTAYLHVISISYAGGQVGGVTNFLNQLQEKIIQLFSKPLELEAFKDQKYVYTLVAQAM